MILCELGVPELLGLLLPIGAVCALVIWMLRVSRRLKQSATEQKRMRQLMEGKSQEEIRAKEIRDFLGPGPRDDPGGTQH